MTNTLKHINSFSTFQGLGYLLGGVFPVGFALAWTIITKDYEIIRTEFFLALTLYTIIGLCIGIIALYIDKHSEKHIKWFFYLQAIFSFFFIHILVIYTGGPKSSVFALSYLYLPSIIGYTYGNGDELWGAAIFLTISYIANLFFLDYQYDIFKSIVSFGDISFGNSNASNFECERGATVYLVVFLIQMVVTSIIASRRSLVDNSN